MAFRSLDVEFRSGDDSCRAWLFVAEPTERPQPCLVMAHGFGLTRRSGLRVFAEAYAREGYCVLLFDYRTFGDSDGSPRQVISFRTQLEDWAAAIRCARERPEVDAGRVATLGFSLGAGHAVTSAARDGNVAAVVGIVPMLSGVSSTWAAMRWWSLSTIIRLVVRGVRDVVAWIVRREPVRVPVSAPTGDLGLLTSPDAYPGYQAVVPPDFEYMVAARIGLHFWAHSPGRALRRLPVPVLLMPSSIDTICPPGPTLRCARRSSNVAVAELHCEHMGALTEPTRSRVIKTTLEFLRQHLPTPQTNRRDRGSDPVERSP